MARHWLDRQYSWAERARMQAQAQEAEKDARRETEAIDSEAEDRADWQMQVELAECECSVCKSQDVVAEAKTTEKVQERSPRELDAAARRLAAGGGGVLEMLATDGTVIARWHVSADAAEAERKSGQKEMEQSIGRYDED